jgi:hypothetical protein
MSDIPLDRPTHDDLQSEQIRELLKGQVDLGRQLAAQLQGQETLARQMAEIVLAHQAIVRRHEEDLPRIERMEATLATNSTVMAEVKEMVSTVTALKGGLKVLGWLGTGAKWLVSIAAVIGLVWFLVQFIAHGGRIPSDLR